MSKKQRFIVFWMYLLFSQEIETSTKIDKKMYVIVNKKTLVNICKIIVKEKRKQYL